jgi:hypothetical protein
MFEYVPLHHVGQELSHGGVNSEHAFTAAALKDGYHCGDLETLARKHLVLGDVDREFTAVDSIPMVID